MKLIFNEKNNLHIYLQSKAIIMLFSSNSDNVLSRNIFFKLLKQLFKATKEIVINFLC